VWFRIKGEDVRSTILAKTIAQLTLTKKATNVLVMDLRKVTPVTDFFVVCSADSEIQIRAITGAVEDALEGKGVEPWHRETGSPNWVILDYVDVVLHVFHRNTREFYSLERLWGDAAITKVEDKPAARAPRKKPAPARTRKKVAR
jgi:ribosome-associated protein